MKKITKEDFFYVTEDNYDEHISRAIPFYEEMHSEIYGFIHINKKDPSILDLGCGTGFTTSVLLNFYPQAKVIAIDLFEEMLNHARERLINYAQQITFVKDDFRKFDFTKIEFDVCVSALALHHILPSEKRQLFNNIYNGLSTDGVFIIIDWTRFESKKIQEIAFDFAVKHARRAIEVEEIVDSWSEHWENINIPNTTEEMIDWLKTAGFKRANCTFRYYGMAMIVAEK